MEGEFQRDDERVVDLRQDGAFGERVGDFAAGDDVLLPDRLEGINPIRVLLHHLHDFAETALANDFEQVEILNLE